MRFRQNTQWKHDLAVSNMIISIKEYAGTDRPYDDLWMLLPSCGQVQEAAEHTPASPGSDPTRPLVTLARKGYRGQTAATSTPSRRPSARASRVTMVHQRRHRCAGASRMIMVHQRRRPMRWSFNDDNGLPGASPMRRSFKDDNDSPEASPMRRSFKDDDGSPGRCCGLRGLNCVLVCYVGCHLNPLKRKVSPRESTYCLLWVGISELANIPYPLSLPTAAVLQALPCKRSQQLSPSGVGTLLVRSSALNSAWFFAYWATCIATRLPFAVTCLYYVLARLPIGQILAQD